MAHFRPHNRHRVRINVRDNRGNTRPLLHSRTAKLPKRLLRWMFGDFCEVIILTPGKTVEELEIQEIPHADTAKHDNQERKRNHE